MTPPIPVTSASYVPLPDATCAIEVAPTRVDRVRVDVAAVVELPPGSGAAYLALEVAGAPQTLAPLDALALVVRATEGAPTTARPATRFHLHVRPPGITEVRDQELPPGAYSVRLRARAEGVTAQVSNVVVTVHP